MLATAALALALLPGVQPLRGDSVVGTIAFPRPQKMAIEVGPRDRLTMRLGFDGRCAGGGVRELWMSWVTAKQALEVRDGTFSGRVTAVVHGVGGRAAWTGHFAWRVSGRFSDRELGTATVSGSVIVRSGGRNVARCDIERPATARLQAA